jgi:hypothetical protein
MKKFKFGGIDKPGIYLDETVMRMCYTHRRLMGQLVINLIQEGKEKKAKEVLDKCEKEIPTFNVPHDYAGGSLDLARGYALTGQNKKAQQIVDDLWTKSCQYMQWYCSLDGMRFDSSQRDCYLHLYILQQLLSVQDLLDEKLSEKKEQQLSGYIALYQSKGGSFE